MVLREFGRTGSGAVLRSVGVALLDDIPAALPENARSCVLFIAADSIAASSTELAALAQAVLERNVPYICCWGPGCERLHDVFDEVEAQRQSDSAPEQPLMTTWHSDEALPEALWFAVHAAIPPGASVERIVLVVSVANPRWQALIEQRLLAGAPDPSEA